MNYRYYVASLVTAILLSSSPARATSSAFAEYYVPFERIQSQRICLSKQMMEAEFGIPLASILQGVFSETRTLRQAISFPNRYENINLLANASAPITPELAFDRYHDNGVYDYSFTLDMAAISALNGSSTAGRQKTIDIAKLAVIATVKTAELTHKKNKFRVWIKFENLPSTAGLTGAAVYSGGSGDWPVWPYTSGSSVYEGYLGEMIHSQC